MTEVTMKKGKIRGVEMDGYTVYKGIPYAKPPVGERRFRSPEELEAWEGVYEAVQFGNRAFQDPKAVGEFYLKEFYDEEEYLTELSDDCLYLNIWTPAKTGEEKLPVMFYIHGGAFFGGFGHEKEFDGEAYCRKNVILVTINYRVGVLGFLAHEDLTREAGRSGNYGILDQIAALDWVYENIGAFGGDPENITVFGQSAGSMNVQTLISSRLTAGKIAKAMILSGGGYESPLTEHTTLPEAEKTGAVFCGGKDPVTIRQLREMPLAEIEKRMPSFMARLQEGSGGFRPPFHPYVDDYVLKYNVDECIDRGDVADIPIVIGCTKNDIGVSKEGILDRSKNGLYRAGVSFCEKLYGRKSPIYNYYFKRDLPGDDAGAFHTGEMWYVFGTLGRCWRPMEQKDYALSERMVTAWTDFAKTGNPGWEAYTPGDFHTMDFDA